MAQGGPHNGGAQIRLKPRRKGNAVLTEAESMARISVVSVCVKQSMTLAACGPNLNNNPVNTT